MGISKIASKNILCFNVESLEELKTINSLAIEMKKIANISIRVNPSIDIKTHPYIATGMKDNKFGVDEKEIVSLYAEASLCKGLKITGIDFHIGSQIHAYIHQECILFPPSNGHQNFF